MSGEGELPDGWRWRTVAELAAPTPNSLTIGPFGSDLKVEHYRECGVPLVFVRDIRSGTFGDARTRFVDAEKAVQLRRHTVKAGDVLITKMGDPPGDTAVYPADRPPGIITADCIKLSPDVDQVSAEFLRDCLLAEPARSQILEQTAGVAQQKLSLERFRGVRVQVPSLREQASIVARLGQLRGHSGRARAALDAIPPLLEKLRQSILAAAFRGDLTNDWRAQNPYVEPASELLKRIRVERRKKWEEAELAKMAAKGKVPAGEAWKAKYKEPEPVDAAGLPELPGGWCWAAVGEVCDLQLGQQRSPDHASAEKTHPYVRAANIKWTGLDLSDVKEMGFPDLERYLLKPGDVLLSEASGSASEVGKPAIWRGEIPGCCYQKTLLRARPVSTGASSEWLHLAFLADALLGRFASMAPGVGILHLTADRMLTWPIAIAPPQEADAVVSAVASALGAVDRLESGGEALVHRLADVDRSVLAKAFRGELVPQ